MATMAANPTRYAPLRMRPIATLRPFAAPRGVEYTGSMARAAHRLTAPAGRTFAAALLFALLPAPTSAQEPSDPPAAASTGEDEIVVTGQSEGERRRQVHRQARDIAVTDSIYDDPLARFEQALCPGIMGLEPEVAGRMIDRLRANARALSLRVLEDGCTPNFVVVFTEDGQRMLGELRRSSGHLFQFLDAGEKRELFDLPGPVRVWTHVQIRTRDGMPVANVRDLTSPPVAQMAMAHSRIYTPTRRDIESVMVVFDAPAVRGLSVAQLADYATMRGLAQTRPASGAMPLGTILALFEGEGPRPEGLTAFDRAYLTSVYHWLPNLPAAAKLGGVARQLRILASEEAE
jgi:hypothetical protein